VIAWLLVGVNGPSATLKVTVILYTSTNQSRLSSSENSVFDMFTAILRNTFKTTMPLTDATVSMKRCAGFKRETA